MPTLEIFLSLLMGIELKTRSLIPEFLPKNVSDQNMASKEGFLRSQSSYSDLLEKFRPLSKRERNFPQIPHPSKPDGFREVVAVENGANGEIEDLVESSWSTLAARCKCATWVENKNTLNHALLMVSDCLGVFHGRQHGRAP